MMFGHEQKEDAGQLLKKRRERTERASGLEKPARGSRSNKSARS
jgi:hypothetical protein